jgi:hypothetical protein
MPKSMNQNDGCLMVFLRLFGIGASGEGADSAAESLPYRVRDDFLSPAERSFHGVLTHVVGGQAVVCPKVNLADIFYVVRPNENQSYRGRIAQKHLDFLLCDPKSMHPIVGIELDDASHARQDRQERDEFVNLVFRAAGLPLIHVPAKGSYSPNELSAQMAQYLGKAPASPTAMQAEPTKAPVTGSTAPLCRKCWVPMVVRTAARGARQGEQFYGCPNYPKCRETLPIG